MVTLAFAAAQYFWIDVNDYTKRADISYYDTIGDGGTWHNKPYIGTVTFDKCAADVTCDKSTSSPSQLPAGASKTEGHDAQIQYVCQYTQPHTYLTEVTIYCWTGIESDPDYSWYGETRSADVVVSTPPECQPDQTKCDGNMPKTCHNGKWTDKYTTPCKYGCINGDCKSVPECTPDGTFKCDDNTVYKCVNYNWKYQKTCNYGCAGTQCAPEPCSPEGKYQCNGRMLERCTSGEWNFVQSCQFECVNNACTGAPPDCTVEGIKRCNPDKPNMQQVCTSEKWVDTVLCQYGCVSGQCNSPPECPTCQPCSEWSTCENAKIVRTCQKCDISTNFMCVNYADEIACCNTDDDCKRTEVCVDNVCVFDQPGCKKDADCGEGEKCMEEICTTWPVTCTTSKECEYLGDYDCVEGECEEKSGWWMDNIGLIVIVGVVILIGGIYFVNGQSRKSYPHRGYVLRKEPTIRRRDEEEYYELKEDDFR